MCSTSTAPEDNTDLQQPAMICYFSKHSVSVYKEGRRTEGKPSLIRFFPQSEKNTEDKYFWVFFKCPSTETVSTQESFYQWSCRGEHSHTLSNRSNMLMLWSGKKLKEGQLWQTMAHVQTLALCFQDQFDFRVFFFHFSIKLFNVTKISLS